MFEKNIDDKLWEVLTFVSFQSVMFLFGIFRDIDHEQLLVRNTLKFLDFKMFMMDSTLALMFIEIANRGSRHAHEPSLFWLMLGLLRGNYCRFTDDDVV